KVTFLLAMAGVAALALYRASSATRHAIWSAALAATLLLPVFVLAVPEWTLPILPSAKMPSWTVEAPRPRTAAPAHELTRSVSRHAFTKTQPARHAATPPGPAPAPTVIAPAPIAPTTPTPIRESPPARPFASWPIVLLGVWIVGAMFVLLRVIIGHMALLRLAHRARPIRA